MCEQPVSNADFVIPVEIDGTIHQVTHSVHVFTILVFSLSFFVILIFDCNNNTCFNKNYTYQALEPYGWNGVSLI